MIFRIRAGWWLLLMFGLVSCANSAIQLSPQELLQRREKVDRLLAIAAVGIEDGSATQLLQAQAALTLAYEALPTDARILDCLGLLAWRKGSLDDAKHWFRMTLNQEPDFVDGYYHLGKVLAQEGNTVAAMGLFLETLRRSALHLEARIELVKLLGEFPELAALREVEQLKVGVLQARSQTEFSGAEPRKTLR